MLGIIIVSLVGLAGVAWYFDEAVAQAKIAKNETAIAIHKSAEAEVARNDAVSSRDRTERTLYNSWLREPVACLYPNSIGDIYACTQVASVIVLWLDGTRSSEFTSTDRRRAHGLVRDD